jgi:adenylylsulfate kinase
MIYWMTGQPGAGKTTLAKLLIDSLHGGRSCKKCSPKVFHIDGDSLRVLTSNQNYTREGRLQNIDTAQKIAHYLHNEGIDVVVSVVSPYRDQRESFKHNLGKNLMEIYVHTTDVRERDQFKTNEYEPPVKNFLDIDTTEDSPEQSLTKILEAINVQA